MQNKPINIMPKSTIRPKVLSELQRQLNQELNAAHAYQAMSIWCSIRNLDGFASFFAKQSGDHPAVLRNMVTSPGGTSAAAIHELESGRLRTVLSEAVWAAFRRTVELGDQLEAQVGAGAGADAGADKPGD